jgi:hypothetical protein
MPCANQHGSRDPLATTHIAEVVRPLLTVPVMTAGWIRLGAALTVLAACELPVDDDTPPRVEATEVRWVTGLQATAVGAASDSARSTLRAVRSEPEGCQSGSTQVHAVAADLSAERGEELVLASIPYGVVVVDPSSRVLAAATPFECGGSADELLGLAVADLGTGRPAIIVVATVGGRAERSTRLAVLEVGEARRLDILFTATLARASGEVAERGAVAWTGHGLLHRPPRGKPTLWIFDPARRRFDVAPR